MEIEAHNANYVGGDVVTGSNDVLQLVFRPRIALNPYSTGIPGVHICSAATPPSGGAHGMCGYNAALSALRHLDPDRPRTDAPGADESAAALMPLPRHRPPRKRRPPGRVSR